MQKIILAVAVGLVLYLPSTTFAQQTLAQSTQLQVHPGDLIALRIWREPDMSGEYLVSRSGIAVFPRLGEIKVSEHTPETLQTLLAQEYRRYLRNPSIEVIVRRRVQIGGAVRNGGLFNVDPTVTISGALAMAGGPTTDGKTDEVLLIRDGEIITTILGGTTLIAESPIRSGDQLFVPMRSWISRNAGLLATFSGLALAAVVAFGN